MSEEPLDRDEVARIANEQITLRFQRIGIWEQTPEAVEITRANNKLVNDLRAGRDAQRGSIKRSLREMLTSAMGQGLWVIVFGIAVYIIRLILPDFQK